MSEIVRAAGLLIYRNKNGIKEFLLLQASYEPHHWTPPKGHVDPGEDEWTAALRETKEEAGIEADWVDVHKDFRHVMRYEIAAKKEIKQVTYWLARLKTIDVVKAPKLSHEHQNSCWTNLEDAIRLTKFPEMSKMLREADEYLRKIQA